MDDQQLSDLLRRLPREEASATFTQQTLRRLAPSKPRRRLTPWRQAIAALLLLAAGFGLHGLLDARAPRAGLAEKQALELIRREHAILKAELAELERLSAAAQPRLYLGRSGDVDLLLDLARFDAGRPRSPNGIRPAVHQPTGSTTRQTPSPRQRFP